MSRPPKRRTKPARARPRREPSPAGTPSPKPIFETALRSARGIHATDDPVQVEAFVSDLLGLFDRPLIDVRDPVDFFGQRLVTHLVAKCSPDAFALLHGIAAVADQPLAESARAGIARLRAAGRTDPAFVDRIGRHRFLDAWTSIDEYGDQELVGVSFADPAGQPHAISFMIDHNFDGLVRNALLAQNLDAVRTSWIETSGMAIVPLDAQALADRLGQGLAMYDLFLDPPSSDEVRQLAVLMKARLRALPPAREPERREVDDDEREALATAFATSKEAGRSAVVAEVARFFIDYRFDYTDGDPLRWSPIAVELCLLDWFPRKVTLDDDELVKVPDALRRFVRYAGRRKGLSRHLIAETIGAVDEFEPPFRAAMRDETRFGPAKSMVTAMMGAGVDLGDERAVTSWIEAFNGRPLEDRDALLGFLGDKVEDASDDADVQARRQWTIQPMTGSVRGIDADRLDPSDPDERRMLIELDHPKLLAALERGDDDIEIDGSRMNPHLHIALHEIVANQLWDGELPETWEAAQRLRDLGHERHEILHMLAGAVAGMVGTGLHSGEPVNLNVDLRRALRGLPGGLSTGPKHRPH